MKSAKGTSGETVTSVVKYSFKKSENFRNVLASVFFEGAITDSSEPFFLAHHCTLYNVNKFNDTIKLLEAKKSKNEKQP